MDLLYVATSISRHLADRGRKAAELQRALNGRQEVNL